eukprot:gnl/Chilomastix_cuspidata/2542.p1 GENE.gnl/Chilomastix_cuspidata/2542~~gnl/Chilomastix_cuspidata/2542.p1  ORF type:complete len:809 (+),score=193.10 gnl/Chilomastix_cuspidata/2542:35-2461(+)
MQFCGSKEIALVTPTPPQNAFIFDEPFLVKIGKKKFGMFEFSTINLKEGFPIDDHEEVCICLEQPYDIMHVGLLISTDLSQPAYALRMACQYIRGKSVRFFAVPRTGLAWVTLRVERDLFLEECTITCGSPFRLHALLLLTSAQAGSHVPPPPPRPLPDMVLAIPNPRTERLYALPVYADILRARIPALHAVLIARGPSAIGDQSVFLAPELASLLCCHPLLPHRLMAYMQTGDGNILTAFLGLVPGDVPYPSFRHLPPFFRPVADTTALFAIRDTTDGARELAVRNFLQGNNITGAHMEAALTSLRDGALYLSEVELIPGILSLLPTPLASFCMRPRADLAGDPAALDRWPLYGGRDARKMAIDSPSTYYSDGHGFAPFPTGTDADSEFGRNDALDIYDLEVAPDAFFKALSHEWGSASKLFEVISARTFCALFLLIDFSTQFPCMCLRMAIAAAANQLPPVAFSNSHFIQEISRVLPLSSFDTKIFAALQDGSITLDALPQCVVAVARLIHEEVRRVSNIVAGTTVRLRAQSTVSLTKGLRKDTFALSAANTFLSKNGVNLPTFGWQGIAEEARQAHGTVVWFDETLNIGVAAFPGSRAFRFRFEDVFPVDGVDPFELSYDENRLWSVLVRQSRRPSSHTHARSLPPRLLAANIPNFQPSTKISSVYTYVFSWVSSSKNKELAKSAVETNIVAFSCRFSGNANNARLCIKNSIGLAALALDVLPEEAAGASLTIDNAVRQGEAKRDNQVQEEEEAKKRVGTSKGLTNSFLVKDLHEFQPQRPNASEDMSWLVSPSAFLELVSSAPS